MKIGIMGYSTQEFDVDKAYKILDGEFKELAEIYNDDVEIVSGLTNLGIPAIAYELATKYGFTTIGIACKKAEEYECFPCDHSYIIGLNWRDEYGFFLDYCDEFIRVGGGKQSMEETSKAEDLGKYVKEYYL